MSRNVGDLFCKCGNYVAITKVIKGRPVNMCANCYQKWLAKENKIESAYIQEQLRIIGEIWFDNEACNLSARTLRNKAINWLGIPVIEKLYTLKTKSELERVLRPYKDGTLVPSDNRR
jgi:hypothetical protein